MSIGNSPEMLSERILVGIILVGRFAAVPSGCYTHAHAQARRARGRDSQNREFAKGGLVNGGLAIYVLLLEYYC